MSGPLRVLVVGGGMYVTGRGTDGPGTILPALFEARRQGWVGEIGLVTTNSASARAAADRADQIGRSMAVDGSCHVFPGDAESIELDRIVTAFRPDAAIVSVPDHLHAEVSLVLTGLKVHVLMVKPMAPTLAEARRMAEGASAAGVLGVVEFHKRYDEANLILRDRVRSGALGSLLYAVIEYSQQKRIPRDIFRGWAGQTNIFQYLGVHYVDLLFFATGFKPAFVTCWGQKEYLAKQGVDTYDSMQVVIEWERPDRGMFVSTHITNWIDPDETTAVSDQKINLVGTAGRFQSDQKHRGVQLVQDGIGVRDVNPYFSTGWHVPEFAGNAYQGYGIRSIIQFIQDVRSICEGRAVPDSFEQLRPTYMNSLVSTAVVEAAASSLRQNHSREPVHL